MPSLGLHVHVAERLVHDGRIAITLDAPVQQGALSELQAVYR